MMAQCMLSYDHDRGKTCTVAWLDVSKLKEGNFVKLKNDDDTMWRIDRIYSLLLPNSYVNERSQDYKRTREASDI